MKFGQEKVLSSDIVNLQIALLTKSCVEGVRG